METLRGSIAGQSGHSYLNTTCTVEPGGRVHFGNSYVDNKANHNQCLDEMKSTDPRCDKRRILNDKDTLLRDSYVWILEDQSFTTWRDRDVTELLWIKGDPGKGKTMMMIGLTEELSQHTKDKEGHIISYFFCQATDDRLNDAAAVLKGLIYMLVTEQPSLMRYLQDAQEKRGKLSLEGVNAFYALSDILSQILRDPSLQKVYFMIDALDECESGREKLLQLIINREFWPPSKIKWVVASRNVWDIEMRLRADDSPLRISLEIHQTEVSQGIDRYINYKVSELRKSQKYDDEREKEVRKYLHENAEGTFLWVALVCKELEMLRLPWKTREVLESFPRGLVPLYDRMMTQLPKYDETDIRICVPILRSVLLAYRPLHLQELVAITELHELNTPLDLNSIESLVALCGSILSVRNSIIYFVHQSAKDYFTTGIGSQIFCSHPGDPQHGINCRVTTAVSSNQGKAHHSIARQSLISMSKSLKMNICGLRDPGIAIEDIKGGASLRPLESFRYASYYWLDHLTEARKHQQQEIDLLDNGRVHLFLKQHFLHWVEVLSLMGKTSQCVIMLKSLEHMLLGLKESSTSRRMIHDANRFLLRFRYIIEKAPLQLYSSALVFSPMKSEIRKVFESKIPRLVTVTPSAEENWSSSIQAFYSQDGGASAVAFSPDGRLLASGLHLGPIVIRETNSGTIVDRILEENFHGSEVAFSPDSSLLAYGLEDGTLRLWNVETRNLQALSRRFRRPSYFPVAFSPSGLLVSGSDDNTVKVWNLEVETSHVLTGHSGDVRALAFAPSGLLASGSQDFTIRLWNLDTGKSRILSGHERGVLALAFSSNELLVSTDLLTVMLWDLNTGSSRCLYNRETTSPIGSLAFSTNDDLLALGEAHGGSNIRLLDVNTGAERILCGHSGCIFTLAFSRDGLLASGSKDRTMRLWDPNSSISAANPPGDLETACSITSSPGSSFLASVTGDCTVKLWDPNTALLRATLHKNRLRTIFAVALSPTGNVIALGGQNVISLCDLNTNTQRYITIVKSTEYWCPITALAFSPDGSLLACGTPNQIIVLSLNTLKNVHKLTLSACESEHKHELSFIPGGFRMDNERFLFTNLPAQYACKFRLKPRKLDVNQEWVTYNGRNLLWLPPDYRANVFATEDNTLAIAHSHGQPRNGRFTFLRFNLDQLMAMEDLGERTTSEVVQSYKRDFSPPYCDISGFAYICFINT